MTLDQAHTNAVEAIRALSPFAHSNAMRPVFASLYRELGELGHIYDLAIEPERNAPRLPQSTNDREQLANLGFDPDDPQGYL